MTRLEIEIAPAPAWDVEGGSWVLIRVGDLWPVECYTVDSSGLETFRGHLHRAPVQLRWRLERAWRGRRAELAGGR